MKTFTIDCSVVVKWLLPEREVEEQVPNALHILHLFRRNAIKILQPVHWLAETASVIVRLEPRLVCQGLDLLEALELPVSNDIEVYHVACQLATRYKHHLFDTLYHAVALCHGNCQFVTADEKYYRKAHQRGAMLRLADFSFLDS